MSYKLIAFDMDGTLLNSRKEITPGTLEAIAFAASHGKTVALSTGRCLAELIDYMPQLAGVRYLCCVSGGYVYDAALKRFASNNVLPADTVRAIFEVARQEDTLVQLMNTDSIITRTDIDRMGMYEMGGFIEMFRRVTTPVDEIHAYFETAQPAVNKVCIYHRTPESRERTMARLGALEAEPVRSLVTSAECSPKGVTKATGLECLCTHLGLKMSEAIAVGDGDNDLDVLKAAGLGIAMDNANEGVKRACHVTVADNDHDGCAEAIYKYLMES